MEQEDRIYDLDNNSRDKRKYIRRAEDREIHIFEHKLQNFFDRFKETDKAHEARMGKLEEQIEKVDKKVDNLKSDMPSIIRQSMEDSLKSGIWIGIKKFFKTLGFLLLIGVATAIIASVSPDLAQFIQEIGQHIEGG